MRTRLYIRSLPKIKSIHGPPAMRGVRSRATVLVPMVVPKIVKEGAKAAVKDVVGADVADGDAVNVPRKDNGNVWTLTVHPWRETPAPAKMQREPRLLAMRPEASSARNGPRATVSEVGEANVDAVNAGPSVATTMTAPRGRNARRSGLMMAAMFARNAAWKHVKGARDVKIAKAGKDAMSAGRNAVRARTKTSRLRPMVRWAMQAMRPRSQMARPCRRALTTRSKAIRRPTPGNRWHLATTGNSVKSVRATATVVNAVRATTVRRVKARTRATRVWARENSARNVLRASSRRWKVFRQPCSRITVKMSLQTSLR